ncbi:hypothetical protein MRX96_007087 [Rhipicephalus microplus]
MASRWTDDKGPHESWLPLGQVAVTIVFHVAPSEDAPRAHALLAPVRGTVASRETSPAIREGRANHVDHSSTESEVLPTTCGTTSAQDPN